MKRKFYLLTFHSLLFPSFHSPYKCEYCESELFDSLFAEKKSEKLTWKESCSEISLKVSLINKNLNPHENLRQK